MGRPRSKAGRIDLEPMMDERFPLLVALDADPEVLRYLLGRAHTAHQRGAFGHQAARTPKQTPSGSVGVSVAGATGIGVTVNGRIGVALGLRQWGQGLGTEGAARLPRSGFADVGLTTAWAETMAVNGAEPAGHEQAG